MKQITTALVIPLLSQFGFAQAPDVEPTQATGVGLVDPAELESFMDGAVTALLEAHDVAGGTVSVVSNGEIFFYWNLLGWNY
jgi:hypothetical protein